MICVLTVTVAKGVTVPRAGIRSWISPDSAVAVETATGPLCPPRPGLPAADIDCLWCIYRISAINDSKAMTTQPKATRRRRRTAMGPPAGAGQLG